MARVTIVVPTYNVEPYITACLESFVQQTNQDFIALVINDGSPANEQAIIDEYVKKYPNIQTIVKENGGYGSVLNRAVKEVKTPYFLICDPDDTLREDAVDILLNKAKDSEVDIVIGAKTLIYSDNHQTKYDPSFNSDFASLKDNQIFEKGTDAFDQLFFVEPSPHAKLYKSSLVKNIVFPEKVSYTDNVLYYLSLLQAQKVTYTSEALSNYLINREGNTRTDLRPSVMDAWMTVLHSILKQSEKFEQIPNMFYYRMFESFKFVFTKIDSIQADENVIKEKLFATQSLLNALLPYRSSILSILNTIQYPSMKLKKLDLDLLDLSKSDQRFHAWAEYQLQRKLKGNIGFKERIKNYIKTNSLLSSFYSIYEKEAKYVLSVFRPRMILNENVNSKIIDPKGQTFFGYYTRSPYRNGRYIYHRTLRNSFYLNQPIDIVLDGNKIAESNTWNWQQGAMLQWMDDDTIIYNDFANQHYVSRILNVNTMEKMTIDFPIYTVSSKGDFALSLNFSRLAKYRPDYGYFNLPYKDVLAFDENDGIYMVDLKKNKSKLWISFIELVQVNPTKTMENAIHKVNHLDLSPDNKNVIFLHRWIKDNQKFTRLIKANIKTKKMTILADHGMVSHCAWVNKDEVISYLSHPNYGDRYLIINGKQELILPQLVDDGHPTISNINNDLVTDAYPDYRSMSKLIFSKAPYSKTIEIGQFYSGRKYKSVNRCDLHPRFSPNKNEVTFDSVCNGKRQLISIDLNGLEQ